MPGFPASHSVSTASQGRFELPAEADRIFTKSAGARQSFPPNPVNR